MVTAGGGNPAETRSGGGEPAAGLGAWRCPPPHPIRPKRLLPPHPSPWVEPRAQASRRGVPRSPPAAWAVLGGRPDNRHFRERSSANPAGQGAGLDRGPLGLCGSLPGSTCFRERIAGPLALRLNHLRLLCFFVAPGNSHFRERVPRSPRPCIAGAGSPSSVSKQQLALGLRWAAPPGPPRRLGGVSGAAMVLLHVKRGDESQFLLQTPGSTELEELTVQVARVYNARLKVQRVCSGAARRRGEFAAGTVEPEPGRVREGRRNGSSGMGKWGGSRRTFLGSAGRGEGQVCEDLQRHEAGGLGGGQRAFPEMPEEPAERVETPAPGGRARPSAHRSAAGRV